MKNLNMNLKRSISNVAFSLKKNSPELLIAAGVVGVVTSAVMACRATLKADEILNKAKEDLDRIDEVAENPDYTEEYDEEAHKKDTALVYVKTGAKLAANYAPSIILGGLSLAAILGSHRILKTRNVGLAAAYAALDSKFMAYDGRVADRLGRDEADELKYGIQKQEIEERTVDENGEEKVVMKTVNVLNSSPDEFTFIFDRNNPNWDDESDYSRMFLHAQETFANDKLHADGHLTLNDVLRSLGFKDTKAGMVLGWIDDKNNEDGDGYVDFGIKEIYRNGVIEFILNFNVDGNIYERL